MKIFINYRFINIYRVNNVGKLVVEELKDLGKTRIKCRIWLLYQRKGL